jgi:hypothetical protein
MANRTSVQVISAKKSGAAPRRRRGAPKGNLNALKTGDHSKQLEALTDAVLANPDVVRLILHLGRIREKRNAAFRKAVRDAVERQRRKSNPEKRA